MVDVVRWWWRSGKVTGLIFQGEGWEGPCVLRRWIRGWTDTGLSLTRTKKLTGLVIWGVSRGMTSMRCGDASMQASRRKTRNLDVGGGENGVRGEDERETRCARRANGSTSTRAKYDGWEDILASSPAGSIPSALKAMAGCISPILPQERLGVVRGEWAMERQKFRSFAQRVFMSRE